MATICVDIGGTFPSIMVDDHKTSQTVVEHLVSLGHRNLGYVSGPLTDTVEGRFAIQAYDSNGYIHNAFLHRDDTNDYDELTMRGKLHWDAGEQTAFDFTLGYINVNNGYDAFSLNNNRTTLSDQPGQDTQKSQFGSVIGTFSQPEAFVIETIVAHAASMVLEA